MPRGMLWQLSGETVSVLGNRGSRLVRKDASQPLRHDPGVWTGSTWRTY